MTTKMSAYRHRGFKMSGGTIIEVFGEGPIPPGAPDVPEWDNWVQETSITSPYANQDAPVASA